MPGAAAMYGSNGSIDGTGRNISTDHWQAYIRFSYLDVSILLKFIARLERSQ